MRQVKNMPKSGQFVAVWECNNRIWSSTYQYVDNELCTWTDSEEDFFLIPSDCEIAIKTGNAKNVKYFRY